MIINSFTKIDQLLSIIMESETETRERERQPAERVLSGHL